MYASLETDVDYFDNFRDVSSKDKRLVRFGAKTFAQTGTYITIKLYKKDEEGTFKYRQGIFFQLVNSSPGRRFTKIKSLTK